jgi:hypothetical protein
LVTIEFGKATIGLERFAILAAQAPEATTRELAWQKALIHNG